MNTGPKRPGSPCRYWRSWAPPDFEIESYVGLENNRNPIAPDGSIRTILQSGGQSEQ